MFILEQMLLAAAIAAAVSAVICAIAIVWVKGRPQQALLPFIVAIGYASGHLFITGWVSMPPADSTNWLPLFALGAAAAGSILPLLPHKMARKFVEGLIIIGAFRLLLEPKFQNAWPNGSGWVWVISLGIAVVMLVWRVDVLSRRSSTPCETPLLLFVVCLGTSGALCLSGSLLLGQFAAVLGAALAGMLVLGWKGPASRESSSLVFSLLLIGIIVSGYFFAELPAVSAFLLGAAPALALIPTPVSGSLRILGARIGLITAPIALALLLAFRASPPLDY